MGILGKTFRVKRRARSGRIKWRPWRVKEWTALPGGIPPLQSLLGTETTDPCPCPLTQQIPDIPNHTHWAPSPLCSSPSPHQIVSFGSSYWPYSSLRLSPKLLVPPNENEDPTPLVRAVTPPLSDLPTPLLPNPSPLSFPPTQGKPQWSCE